MNCAMIIRTADVANRVYLTTRVEHSGSIRLFNMQ